MGVCAVVAVSLSSTISIWNGIFVWVYFQFPVYIVLFRITKTEYTYYVYIEIPKMAFTRFHDDPVRIEKALEESTFIGRYQLDTPGPGVQLPYIADPQMRIQRWGANLATDTTNLESQLFCLNRKLLHNYDEPYNQPNIYHGTTRSYPLNNEHVLESRASHPSWMYRDLEQTRWETPFINPLANTERTFANNICSRIQAKDAFTPVLPSFENFNRD
jgi:hypothetical protein